MKVFPGITLPTPFGGSFRLPDIETPPLALPKPPDARSLKVIGHGVGEDISNLVGLIPYVGQVVGDLLEDMHHAEILKLLTKEEYQKFTEYNKVFPSTIALARTLLFK